MKPLRNIAIVVNREKPGAETLAERLSQCAGTAGALVSVTTGHPLPEGFLADKDVACVVGGDGTLLGVVPQALRYDVKVLGINLGKLGFLVTHSPETIFERFQRIMQGEYLVSPRSVLVCSHPDMADWPCLNDVVIKERRSRLLSVEVDSRGEQVNAFACDGLIVATPTGSTAYNLSAGGPILHPEMEAMVMTPICPHTLSNRSVVFPPSSELRVICRSRSSIPLLSLDGEEQDADLHNKPLTVRTLDKKLPLIEECGHDHFATIRAKLDWTESKR